MLGISVVRSTYNRRYAAGPGQPPRVVVPCWVSRHNREGAVYNAARSHAARLRHEPHTDAPAAFAQVEHQPTHSTQSQPSRCAHDAPVRDQHARGLAHVCAARTVTAAHRMSQRRMLRYRSTENSTRSS